METKNSYFQTGELAALLTEMKNKAKEKAAIEGSLGDSSFSAYDFFIQLCQSKTYAEGTILERHHILPKHAGGDNGESNIILLSVKDHITAHWLRWQVLNSINDKTAYIFRVGTSEEKREVQLQRIKENVAGYKRDGKYMFDSAWQRAQGLKGGSKGGSAGTKAQWEARAKVGREFGRQTGKGNQSPETINFLATYSMWEFIGFIRPNGAYVSAGKATEEDRERESSRIIFNVFLSPKETMKEIADTLSLFAPGSINFLTVASLYKVIQFRDKRIFGWKCIKTLTRSEVEAGALSELSIDFFTEDAIPE
jgi:hypothetical protein